jgi:hypothetical protein
VSNWKRAIGVAAAYVSGSSAGMAGMEAIQPSDETPGVNDHTAAGVGGELTHSPHEDHGRARLS